MKLYAIKNTKTGEYVTFSYEYMYEEVDNTYMHFDYYGNYIFFQDYEINLEIFTNESLSGTLYHHAKYGLLEVVEVTLP